MGLRAWVHFLERLDDFGAFKTFNKDTVKLVRKDALLFIDTCLAVDEKYQ